MINGRTHLHVVANGTMTGQRYIDEVLLPHVRLFRGAVGDKFVFMDDNATCHRTLAVQYCLDSEGIQRLVWPARSLDLNPIENVWDALGRQVAGRNYPPTTKNTLIRALIDEWDKLPQQLLDNDVQIIVFELKSERTQTNQFYTGTPFALQIALHSPYSLVNPFMNGFSLKPCSNYHVFPSKQINKLLPPPYSSQCYNYTESWLKRSGRGPRNKRLCSEECYLNKSVEVKGCVDPFFIAYPNMEKICTDEVQPYVYEKCRDYCRPACFSAKLSTYEGHPKESGIAA
ncbi:transposable element Tc1 transposase [Trichonephila clavipes]|nr:transposable element Tc1 transposase [Trichonephila clavipes]